MFPGKLYSLATTFVLIASVVGADEQRISGGFVLGGTFEAAQKHAGATGSSLAPLSDDKPGFWSVTGTNLTLSVCGTTVTSINGRLDGDFEEFTALVASMTTEHGEPDTQILSIPSAVGVIATIDARFVTDDGGALVQLQSIGEKRTLSVNHWIDSDCR